MILGLLSCEKKISLKVKDQAQEYPVIFGIVCDDPDDNIVRVTITESYSGKKADGTPAAVLKAENPFGEIEFTNLGNNRYQLASPLEAYMPYVFTCAYNSVDHEYQTMSPGPVIIDSVQLIKQTDGRFRINVNFFSFEYAANLLAQVKTGEVITNTITLETDTVWKNYNERFPGAQPKIQFLQPLQSFADTNGVFSVEVLNNCPFVKNELIRIELYSIDQQSVVYLNEIKLSQNSIYDPLAISPPVHNFVFSNKALGIIIPAMKSRIVLHAP